MGENTRPNGHGFVAASDTDVDRIVAIAAAAAPAVRAVSPDGRAAFLEQIGERLLALGDAVVETAHRETSLPLPRLIAERQRTVDQLRLFAGVVREGDWVDARIEHGLPDRTPLPRPDLRRMLIPLGPVGVFGASNFPFAFSVAGGDTASALAAGCPVVVKAHPAHPATSDMAAGAIREAAAMSGMPEGVFSMVHGGVDTGMSLVRHPLLAAVSFTGSLRAGRAIFDAAAARPSPIPVYAEMGSVNPVFLLPAALEASADRLAAGLAQSVTVGVGQFCTNPGLVVAIETDCLTDFIAKLADLVGGTAAGTMLTPEIAAAYAAGRARMGATSGVRCAVPPHLGGAAPAVFTADAATYLSDPSLAEELFGPSTLVVRCRNQEELMAVAGSLAGQLTATVHAATADVDRFGSLCALLETKAGRVVFNGFPTGVEVSRAMQHGGPYPATTDSRSTSVGTASIERFGRPVCWQDAPAHLLPPELQDGNPRHIWRTVDGERTRDV